MRKGLVGPYQLGAMKGLSEGLNIAEKVTGRRGTDLEAIFYATAFQAGIDEFLVADSDDRPETGSKFVREHIRALPTERWRQHYEAVESVFKRHLPTNWHREDKYSPAWKVQNFLVDLLVAMDTQASLLSPWGIPDPAEAEAVLPPEIVVPVSNLLGAVEDLTVASPVLQRALPREDLERFSRIINSDLFRHYVGAASELDEAQNPASTALQTVSVAGKRLFRENRQVLALRRSLVGVLQITPKLVDAVFGKLPGMLAELGARLGLALVDSRRRIVIYDFRPSLEGIFVASLLRMFRKEE
jgi:hypothetical protein